MGWGGVEGREPLPRQISSHAKRMPGKGRCKNGKKMSETLPGEAVFKRAPFRAETSTLCMRSIFHPPPF